MRRIYEDNNILVDWDVDPDALLLPPDDEARRQWGWQQDADGRWYRELADGQKIGDPPLTPPSA